MKTWLASLGILAYFAGTVVGNEVQLKEDDAHRQRCSGMYGRKSWGGSIDPFIHVKFLPVTDDSNDPLASLIIFEWQDEDLIGMYKPGSSTTAPSYEDFETICDPSNVGLGLCTQEEVGRFILQPNATDKAKSVIYTEAVHLKDSKPVNYPIKKTGYYCVSTVAYSDHPYTAIVEFRNSFGELPAAQIAKLPFYGGLTIVYAVLGVFWAFLYVQNRSDILPVQNYITATLIFLIIEQLMTWGYYDYQNTHGNNALNKTFMVLVSVLNAGRNSLSFFLLLIVCMGYGVVKHTLGRTMIYVRILAIAHFVFGVIYAVASLSITPDSAGPLVLLVIMPLSATLTAFYVWTLSSLNLTMKDLAARKQKTKFMMYKKLWWCLLGSIIVIFGFFFINSFAMAGSYSNEDFIPAHWQSRWFVLDGWLNIVYLCDIAFVAYLWRPTANNRRFAMSDELAQDDDGFEIRSIADSLSENEFDLSAEEHDAEAAAHRKLHDKAAQPSGGASTSLADTATMINTKKGTSTGPANTLPPAARPRESLDGETIFAVGDEGVEWSDASDDEADERKKVTRKI